MLHPMENQRIEILDQIQMLETGDVLGLEEAAARSHLVKNYNEIVQNIYLDTPGLFWDIIEAFPEDIWIQIIQEALPTYQYAAALLTLTMVSSKWLQVLTSTPILWTYIEIRGSDEDSLATIGIFTHLSREASLAITIYLPLRHDAITIRSILATVGGRIQKATLAADKRVYGEHQLTGIPPESYYAGVRFLIGILQHAPNASVIVIGSVGQIPGHDDEVLKTATGLLPPILRAMHGYCFCQREHLDRLLHLEELQTCEDLHALVPHLKKMTRLRSLTLFGRGVTEGNHRGLIKALASLPNLTSLSFHGTFHPSGLDLLEAVAPNLVNLKLYFPLPQLPSIFSILRSCIRLRTLSVHIRDQGKRDQGDVVSKVALGSSILGLMSLRSLEFTALVSRYSKDDERRPVHLEQLSLVITSITELSGRVEEASFRLDFANEEYYTRRALECISKLPNLKRLNFHGVNWPSALDQPHITTLKQLEEFDTPFPEAFGSPSLLSAIWQCGIGDHSSISTYVNVRTLHINDYDGDPHWIKFPQDSFPHLTNLKLIMGGHQHLLLGSFLLLTFISIRSGTAGATSLCIALLYKPEDCPCLSKIEFLHSSPEWDILFIMLERRNFLTNHSISRIRRISFPFISNGLRAPLARLLRGIYGNRPSNEDLSFEAVVNLVFDKQIHGCLSCLRNMLGACNELFRDLGRRTGREVFDLSIYSTVDNPPPLDLDSAIADWINRREMYALSWKSAAEDLGPQCWRREICNKRADARVEVTEHDVP